MNVLFGLPAHPLLVHLTVVTIPLAALLAMVVAGSARSGPGQAHHLGPRRVICGVGAADGVLGQSP
jgi:hypothetical protein